MCFSENNSVSIAKKWGAWHDVKTAKCMSGLHLVKGVHFSLIFPSLCAGCSCIRAEQCARFQKMLVSALPISESVILGTLTECWQVHEILGKCLQM